MAAIIERQDDQVVCRGRRTWLKVEVPPRVDGARIHSATTLDREWHRVDDDVPSLTRAVTRLVTDDLPSARRLLDEALAMTGIPPRDRDPVTGLTRVAFPLLANPRPWPLVAVPTTLPADLQPAFRSSTPRTAAAMLFPGRATRPVVRAFSELLSAGRHVDMFAVTVAQAAAPLLEPDHLARLLRARGASRVDGSPLGSQDVTTLRRLLSEVPPRRVVEVLTSAINDVGDRRRARFVARECTAGVSADLTRDWTWAAVTVLAGHGDETGDRQ